jgi:hypothetical protein
MGDAFLVCGSESGGDLLRILNGPGHGQRALIELRAQLFAFEQFHHDERRALVIADVVDGRDVWVIERGGGLRFLLEAAHTLGIRRQFSRQQFERDFALEARVFGQPDLAHPARAEWGKNFIRSKLCSGLNAHHLLPVGTRRFTSSDQLRIA